MTRSPLPVQSVLSTQWRKMIISGARGMGIHVTDDQMGHMFRFAQMLLEWNRRVNLTAITDPEEVAVKHFLDSMAALPYIPENGRLLDIGSGGGFPGLVLAIFRPSLSITSIDSVRKKISFQRQLIRTLGLTSARAIHARAESLTGKTEPYDIIVSRALGSLEMFVSLALPLISEEGELIAYKGIIDEGAGDEIESLTSQYNNHSIHVYRYLLPSSGDRRSLVFIKHR